jgi:membrane-bound lytic murein transglycosylase B
MRLKRVDIPSRSTPGRVVARRARRWELIATSTVAAFTVGCFVTVAANGATAQPMGTGSRALAALGAGVADPSVKPYLNQKLLKAVPVGPGAVSKPVQTVLTSPGVTTALDASGIPEVALEAYQRAAATLATSDPACKLPWQLLAAIGRVESDNGQFGGAMLLPNGNTTKPIYGIPLDGQDGVALVLDSVDAELDGYSYFAMAVGPMQFLPSTWAVYGADGNGDGKKDPNNIFDAALGAADYLCAGGGSMTNPVQEAAAVRRYNDADEYVRVVLALEASYEDGDAATVPAAAGAPAPTSTPIPSATQAPAQALATQPSPSATPTPVGTTETGPASSDQPGGGPVPSAIPRSHTGQTVDIGWAPAMRQVVVNLLTGPKAALAEAPHPAQPGPQPTAVPVVTTVCAAPATPAGCAADMVTRPGELQVSEAGTDVVKNITWTDWGSATAYGTGTLYVSNCNPSCAGATGTGYPATITASGITAYGQGTSAYSLVEVQAPDLPYDMSFSDGLVP